MEITGTQFVHSYLSNPSLNNFTSFFILLDINNFKIGDHSNSIDHPYCTQSPYNSKPFLYLSNPSLKNLTSFFSFLDINNSNIGDYWRLQQLNRSSLLAYCTQSPYNFWQIGFGSQLWFTVTSKSLIILLSPSESFLSHNEPYYNLLEHLWIQYVSSFEPW